MLRERDISFVLVTMPMQKEITRNRYDQIYGLGPFAEEHGVKVIDPKPYIHEKLASGDNKLQDLYWPLDYHYTPLGYAYFAEAVEEGLIRLRQVK